MGYDAPTLSVTGGFSDPVRATPYVIQPTDIVYTYGVSVGPFPSNGAPIVDGNVLYTVVTPPAHGQLLKSGSPTTVFTAQDVVDGLITYLNDSTGTSDTFRLWCEVTDVVGVVSPYTPHFVHDVDTSIPSTTKGAFYYGLLLAGASAQPVMRLGPFLSWAGGNYLQVAYPSIPVPSNSVVFFVTSSRVVSLTSFPASYPIASISLANVSGITRLGGGSFNAVSSISGVLHYSTVTAELWWGTSTTGGSGSALSVVWTGSGPSLPPLADFVPDATVNLRGYNGLADLANPWGTDPASIEMYVTSTIPGSLSLTTAAADQLVLPITGEILAGGSAIGPALSPKGFSELGFSATLDYQETPQQRTAICYADIPITLPDDIVSASLADLWFGATTGFVDPAVTANRRLFVGANDSTQNLGADGSTPFGVSPAVFLTRVTDAAADTWAVNAGVGGSFAVLNGDLTVALTRPPCSTTFPTPPPADIARFDAPQMMLDYSKDGGVTWAPLQMFRSMGQVGEYIKRLRWLNLGVSRTWVFRIQCTDPVRRYIIGAYIDDYRGLG